MVRGVAIALLAHGRARRRILAEPPDAPRAADPGGGNRAALIAPPSRHATSRRKLRQCTINCARHRLDAHSPSGKKHCPIGALPPLKVRRLPGKEIVQHLCSSFRAYHSGSSRVISPIGNIQRKPRRLDTLRSHRPRHRDVSRCAWASVGRRARGAVALNWGVKPRSNTVATDPKKQKPGLT